MISPGVCDLGPVKLHYLQAGVGDLVLCLHGFPDHAPSLRAMLEELAAAGFRAVAPFMRGYAPSTVEARTYESAALAGDVLGLGASLASGADVMLVGHDWGGVAALHAAVLQPERVRRLVTIGMPHARTYARALEEDPVQQRMSWYAFLFLLEGFAERVVADRDFAFVERLIAEWSPRSPFSPEEWYALRRTLSARGVLTAAMGYYRSALGVMPRDPILARDAARWDEAVRVPTLAIYGERDGCIRPEVHAAQGEHFAGDLRLRPVAGVGHWPHLEDPRRVLPDIAAFLRSVNPADAGPLAGPAGGHRAPGRGPMHTGAPPAAGLAPGKAQQPMPGRPPKAARPAEGGAAGCRRARPGPGGASQRARKRPAVRIWPQSLRGRRSAVLAGAAAAVPGPPDPYRAQTPRRSEAPGAQRPRHPSLTPR